MYPVIKGISVILFVMDFEKNSKTQKLFWFGLVLCERNMESFKRNYFLTHKYADLIVLSAICAIQQYRKSVDNSEPWTAP